MDLGVEMVLKDVLMGFVWVGGREGNGWNWVLVVGALLADICELI